MKSWVTIVLALGLFAGCRPSDQRIKSVRDRVMDGELVEFTKPGYSLCGKSSAWTDMRIYETDERSRIVLNKQRTIIATGHSACYRIGTEIAITDMDRHVRDAGRVRIDRISLVLLDKLPESKLRGRFFASSNNAYNYKSDVSRRMKAEHEGIVTLVDLTYIPGSAADEKDLRQKDTEKNSGDGYEQTENDGDQLPSGCGKSVWTTISFPPEMKDLLSQGLKSWYQLDSKNCFKQGQEADLTEGRKGPAIARVKIGRIKRFRISYLDAKFFFLPEHYDFEQIKSRITQENTRGAEFMTVMDFELVPAPGGAKQ